MCSGIKIIAEDGTVVVGRTLDAKDIKFRTFANDDVKGTFTFDDSMCLDGMNAFGLAVFALYFPGYTYNKLSPVKTNVRHTDVVTFFLEKARTVQDVLNILPHTNIVQAETNIPSFHWFIADSSGISLVLEPSDGALKWYRNGSDDISACTNSPSFENHLVELRKSQNFPGDFSSVSRFVRLTYFATHIVRPPDGKEAVNSMFRILNNFDIPPGISDDGHTLYTSVYNLNQKTLSHRNETQSLILSVRPIKK